MQDKKPEPDTETPVDPADLSEGDVMVLRNTKDEFETVVVDVAEEIGWGDEVEISFENGGVYQRKHCNGQDGAKDSIFHPKE